MNVFGKDLQESFGAIERLSTLISHILVSILMACVAASIVQFGRRFSPGWDGSFFPWVIWVITLEAMVAKRISSRLAPFTIEWLVFRGTEIVVIMIGLKALLYLLDDPSRLLVDLDLWQADFVSFFTPGYLGLVVIGLASWALSSWLSEILLSMEGDPMMLGEEVSAEFNEDRQQAREQLFNILLVLGAFMVLLTSAVRMNLEAIWGDRPPIHGNVYTLIAYFVIVMILLSQTQFAILRASWRRERISLKLDLGKRWVVYSLVFLLLLAGVALVLPTRYSLGLLSILNYLLGILAYGILQIWGIVMLVTTALLRLFGLGIKDSESELPSPVLPIPLEVPASPNAPIPWLELLKSILFWILFLGVIGLSLYQFLKQRQDLWVNLRLGSGLAWLTAFWAWIKSWIQGVNRRVGAAVTSGLRSIRRLSRNRLPVEPWRFVNLRRLSPRERVLFFYLALARRSKERGIQRQESQTPYEYEQLLLSALPGGEEELAGITAAFVEARYSLHTIDELQASKAQRWWQYLRRLLTRA